MVYSAALRQVGGDTHRAQDVLQLVFTAAARKAVHLSSHPRIAGWLYMSTRHAAAQTMRTERRRTGREQEAHALGTTETLAPREPTWEEVKPLLDEAMHALGEQDREAMLLRYFTGMPFGEIGAQLGVSQDAVRKRVERGVQKLRAELARRGVTSTAAALSGVISQNAIASVPSGVIAEVASLASGSAAAGGAGASLGFLFMNKAIITTVTAIVGAAAIGMGWELWTRSRLSDEIASLETSNAGQTRSLVIAERELASRREELAAATASVSNSVARASTEADRQQAQQRKGSLDSSYAGLFRRLRLDPERLERLKTLLVQRMYGPGPEIARALRDSGVSREELGHAADQRLMEIAAADIDQEIAGLLGPAGFQRFKAYADGGLYQMYEEMARRLYHAGSPLSDEQVDRLVDLTAAARNEQFSDPDAVPAETLSLMIPDDVPAKASEFLSASQLETLRELKESREAASELIAMNRAAAIQGKPKLTRDTAPYYPTPPKTGGTTP